MITKAQKEKLLLAIDRADGYGKARYLFNSKPCCVIGQLAAIEGISITDIKSWANNCVARLFILNFIVPLFTSYPVSLLARLQRTWDSGLGSPEMAKFSMKQFVEAEEMSP